MSAILFIIGSFILGALFGWLATCTAVLALHRDDPACLSEMLEKHA